MKYNTTYTPKTSLKDTLREIDFVTNEIIKFYRTRFEMTHVYAPLFFEENDPMLFDLDNITRSVTFDISDGYKIAKMVLSHSNWMRSIVDKIKLNRNEGIYTTSSTIWRDIHIDPVSYAGKQELVFQIRAPKDMDQDEMIRSETDLLYSEIERLENYLCKKYELKKILPENIDYISAQMLENEFPNISPKEREIEMMTEKIAYILTNPSLKLFSGHIHSNIPKEIYSQKHFNQILAKDLVNYYPIKIASIGLIANGDTLSDQLTMEGKDYLKETAFYSRQIKNDYNLFEVKIDIGRLMMTLMKKGHISEVVPGNISDEASIISTRYKVDKY